MRKTQKIEKGNSKIEIGEEESGSRSAALQNVRLGQQECLCHEEGDGDVKSPVHTEGTIECTHGEAGGIQAEAEV